MPVSRETANYQEKSITEFIGNPLIAALPNSVSQKELLRELLKLPPARASDRTEDPASRLHLLSRINSVHIPYEHDLFIARSLSRCIFWGYTARNPMPFEVTESVLKKHGQQVTVDVKNYLTKAMFPIYGFSILGISGVGKSCSVTNALRQFPQVIDHVEYNGVPFHCAQIVWLKIACADASPKGICTAILHSIDNILGTHYLSEVSTRISKDVLMTRVSACLAGHHVGVIVVDDIQNLTGAKKDTSSDILSFLIYLMETLAIPVVMVGTPKVRSLFQQEFQLAKRATGDGTVRMGLLKQDSVEWNRFIAGIWGCQFTEKRVDLTQELNRAFYHESVGNPFLCSLLYKLVQDDAITSGIETFSVEDVQKVANEKLCITTSMRRNMLNGNDEELRRYEYLWNPVTMPAPVLDLGNWPNPAPEHRTLSPAESITEELVSQLGLNLKQATSLAQADITARGSDDYDVALGFAMEMAKISLTQEPSSDAPEEKGTTSKDSSDAP